MRDQDFYDRNVEAIKTHLPDLWTALSDLTPLSTVVWDGETPVNLDLGGVMLYPEPVQAWNQRQMEDIEDDPGELHFNDILHCNPTKAIFPLVRSLQRHVIETGTVIASKRRKEVAFAIILGVGLGLHLEAITASEEVRHFVIYEPTLEFIKHSLWFANWHDLLKRQEEGQCQVSVFWTMTPEQMANQIRILSVRQGVTFLEGTTLHPHYLSMDIKQAYIKIRKALLSDAISTGFFEDELNMLCNSTRNFLRYPCRLIRKEAHLRQMTPAFVVAAGPSLDNDIDQIRALSDRAVIISCGTALGILLKAGITPDLHVENENSPATATVLDALAAEYDLSSIRLVASSSVIPGPSRHFLEPWYYFRAGISSTLLFAPKDEPLYGTFPLVANAGFSVANRLGFYAIYLFGCDCGSRDTSRHHATGSVYHTDTLYTPEEMEQKWRKGQDRILPGNFGGTVHSTLLYDMSRHHLTVAVSHASTQYLYNCSDGARIDGFMPQDSLDIEIPETAPSKQDTLALLAAQLEQQTPQQVANRLRALDKTVVLKSPHAFYNELKAELDTVDYGASPFRRLNQAVRNVTTAPSTFDCMARPVMSSSIESMVRVAAYLGTRIEDPKQAEAFFLFTKTAMLECMATMADTCEAAFTQWYALLDTPELEIPYFT